MHSALHILCLLKLKILFLKFALFRGIYASAQIVNLPHPRGGVGHCWLASECQFVHRKVISSMSLQSENAAAEVRDAVLIWPTVHSGHMRQKVFAVATFDWAAGSQTAAGGLLFRLLNCLRFSNALDALDLSLIRDARNWSLELQKLHKLEVLYRQWHFIGR